jgi:hypothetical protein
MAGELADRITGKKRHGSAGYEGERRLAQVTRGEPLNWS